MRSKNALACSLSRYLLSNQARPIDNDFVFCLDLRKHEKLENPVAYIECHPPLMFAFGNVDSPRLACDYILMSPISVT